MRGKLAIGSGSLLTLVVLGPTWRSARAQDVLYYSSPGFAYAQGPGGYAVRTPSFSYSTYRYNDVYTYGGWQQYRMPNFRYSQGYWGSSYGRSSGVSYSSPGLSTGSGWYRFRPRGR